jgi:hypothetical protein
MVAEKGLSKMVKLLIIFNLFWIFTSPLQAFSLEKPYPMNSFEWLPTESAPSNYPMYIIKGDLIFENGESIYIPDQKIINNGWGKETSTHIVGDTFKPLPTQLQISWFSFTEDRFYAGKFDLPKDKLLELFQHGTASPYENNERWNFDRIVVGVAPGGDVAVWAGAGRIVKEIRVFRAQPADLPWSLVLDNPNYSRQQHISESLEEALSPQVLKQVKANPVPLGKWAIFAKRYPWIPKLSNSVTGKDLWVKSFNGEIEWLDLTGTRHDIDRPPQNRAIPEEVSIYWRSAGGINLTADISFNEEETLAAFNKLGNLVSPEPMILIFEPSDTTTSVDVLLQRGKAVYRFQHSIVKIYKGR